MSDWNPVNWVEAAIRLLDWLGSRIVEIMIFWFVSAAVLLVRFLSSCWLVLVGFNVHNARYVNWSGWSFAFSTLYLVIFGGSEQIRRARIRNRLRHASPDEKDVLVNRFLAPSVSTVLAFLHEPGFASLVDAGVLKMSMTNFTSGQQMGIYRFTPRIERYVAKRRVFLIKEFQKERC